MFEKNTDEIVAVFTATVDKLKQRAESLSSQIKDKEKVIEAIYNEKVRHEEELIKNNKYVKKLESFFE